MILGIVLAVIVLGLVLFFFTNTFRSGPAQVDVDVPSPQRPDVNIEAPDVTPDVNVEAPDAPDVNVEAPDVDAPDAD